MPPPFDVLGERLLRAGIAPRHVKRYLRELSEHLDDLAGEEEKLGRSPMEARSLAVRRLGDVETLVRAMSSREELHSWAHRAPWVVFVLAPIVAQQAILVLTIVATTAIGGPRILHLPQSERLQDLWNAGQILMGWISPVAIGCVLAFVAGRQKLRFLWPVLGPVLAGIAGLQIMTRISPLGISFFPYLSPLRHVGVARVLFFFGRGLAKTVVLTLAPYTIWRLGVALRALQNAGAT